MVNWIKVIANAGVAFTTTLAGLVTFEGFSWEVIPPALLVAGIQFMLAVFVSLKQEEENSNPSTGSTKKKGISYLTLF